MQVAAIHALSTITLTLFQDDMHISLIRSTDNDDNNYIQTHIYSAIIYSVKS